MFNVNQNVFPLGYPTDFQCLVNQSLFTVIILGNTQLQRVGKLYIL